ncbi:hypothetical protein RQP46_005823 [Phenoliferia psychrophenolica]
MSQAPVSPPSFLSLPDELLIKIARDVAPDGGRKAGNLRLVCRHLSGVLAPVTWASIVLPSGAEALDIIASELVSNTTQSTSCIKSIRYNKPDEQLRLVVSAIKALPSLRRLHLAGTSEDDEGLFVPEHGDFEGRTEPFSFELAGATKLFKESPPNDPAVPFIVQILNWIAHGPLTTLTLPVFDAFFANDALSNLSLPRVQTLVLDVDPWSLDTPSRDLISLADSSNYAQLVRFLTLASLPTLATLHLRGWLEATGASSLSSLPVDALPTEAPLIYLLLGVLRKTTIVELRLENSISHAESDVQCIFSREGNGEWKSRLGRFW